MVDLAVMLGADQQAAEAQMRPVLEFEIKVAQVRGTLDNPTVLITVISEANTGWHQHR